jgi:hypothetical protein
MSAQTEHMQCAVVHEYAGNLCCTEVRGHDQGEEPTPHHHHSAYGDLTWDKTHRYDRNSAYVLGENGEESTHEGDKEIK